MAVRDAFPLAADPWTLQVDALPRSPLGCRKRSLCEMLTAHAQLEATHTGTQRVTAPAAEKILCVLNEQCSIDDAHISAGAATKEVTHPAPCVEQLKQGDPSEKQVEEKETWTAKVCDAERRSKGTELVPPPCAAEPTKEANSSAQSSPGAVPPMYYSLLKDLTDRSPSCRIRTRIARLWKHELQRKHELQWKHRMHHMRSDKYLVGLHMVLVDEEGQGIHAFVPKSQIDERLKEGRVYYFQNFETMQVKAGTPWRCAYHSCEARFTARTQVNPILPEPDDFPPYAHCLRSFKDILDTVEDNTYLADVVGLVTGISDIVRFKVKPKRTVRLYDGSDHAIINLWDEFAYKLDADELIRRSESEPVILLAMGCIFKKEYSMLSLNTAYGCRIRINPASDVSGFRNRIIGIGHLIERIDDKGHTVVESTTVTNLVSEGSSSGAGHTGSCVDAVSTGDPVAERTVSVAQEHNAELPSSLDPESLEKNEPASGEMSRTHVVEKKRATPPGDVLATPSDMKRNTISSSNGGDNPRGPSGKRKKKSDKDPNMLAKAASSYALFQRVKTFCFARWSGRGGARS